MELLQAVRTFTNPVLDLLFEGITILGEQVFLAGLFCVIYWCVDKRAGRVILLGLCFGTCLNGLIKDLVRAPRPFWEAGVGAIRTETATGYSFPSGHTQASSTVYTALALRARKGWFAALCGILILSIAFSRLYLGVHYLQDVAAALVLGVGTALLIQALEQRTPLVLGLCAAAAIACLLVARSHDSYAAVGLTLGLFPGLWLEARHVNFAPVGRFSHGLLRVGGGALLILAIYAIPKLIFEKSAALYLIRNAAIAFVGVGGYPWLFTRASRKRAK